MILVKTRSISKYSLFTYSFVSSKAHHSNKGVDQFCMQSMNKIVNTALKQATPTDKSAK